MADPSGRHVVGATVDGRIALGRAARCDPHSADHVADVDIRLALSSVTENSKLMRIAQQLPQKIESDTMRLPWSYDVAEPKDSAREFEHVAIRADQPLACK